MPHIGNDVVDLTDPVNVRKTLDLRFLKKILTSAEIEFVRSAKNPAAVLWSLWACKETAYKVMKKASADTAFLPSQWKVTISETGRIYEQGEVIISASAGIFTRLFISEKYVHCIGTDDLRILDKIVWDVDIVPPPEARENVDPSLFVRDCLVRRVAGYFHLNYQHLEIRRVKNDGELQPPIIYYNEERYPVDVSLSHDGNFVAYSFISI